MEPGLTLRIVERDEDYLGVEILAAHGRFAGATRVHVGLDELGDFALEIEGFPAHARDERTFELGSAARGVAGGFARFRFHCTDGSGHAALEIELEDDEKRHGPASARFGFPIHAAGVDRFAGRLRRSQEERSGEACLPAVPPWS